MALYPYDRQTLHRRVLAYLSPNCPISSLAGTALSLLPSTLEYEFSYRWHGDEQRHEVLIPSYIDFDKMIALIRTHMKLTKP